MPVVTAVISAIGLGIEIYYMASASSAAHADQNQIAPGSGVPQITTQGGSSGSGHGMDQPETYNFEGKSYKTLAEAQAAQSAWEAANPGSGGAPGASGTHYDSPATSAAGGNAPGAPGDQSVPYATDVLNERADAANLAQVAYEQQGLSSITGLKLQEQKAESAIVAGAAARGLKLEGSPLYQLNAQKEAGATAIGSAETQFKLGDRAQKMQTLASYNAGLLNLSDKNMQIQTDLSNMWLSTFSSMVGTASSFIGKFWNPAQSMNQGGTAQSLYTEGSGYTPYMSEY